jgi:hypothetical protein
VTGIGVGEDHRRRGLGWRKGKGVRAAPVGAWDWGRGGPEVAAHGGRRAAAALLAVKVVLARGRGGGRAREHQKV